MLEFLFNYPVIPTVSALIFGLGALVSFSLHNFMPLLGSFIISMVLAFASHVDYSQRSIFTCYEDENKCIRDLIIKIPSEVSSFSEYDAWLNRPKSEWNDWWWLMLLLVVLLFLPK